MTKNVLLGGDTVGQEALIRFYVLHVALLPMILFALDHLPFLAHPQGRRYLVAQESPE